MAPKTAGSGHKSTGGGSTNAAAGTSAGGGGGKSAANVQLQDRLHELLSKLAGTIEDVKDWPENVDSAGHYKTTTKLIDRIQEVIKALKRVEDCINNKGDGSHKNNVTLREHLQKCLIPMDLLELLDHNASTNMHDKEFGLNPECYASGLLREAMFQLAGLKRRKNALEMLGNAIERGLAARNKNSATTTTTTTTDSTATDAAQQVPTEQQSDAATAGKPSSLKRGRDQSETTTGDAKKKAKS
jgi:hypothetical protein